jgi:hypothetical protein
MEMIGEGSDDGDTDTGEAQGLEKMDEETGCFDAGREA